MTAHDPWLLIIAAPIAAWLPFGYVAFVKEALRNGRLAAATHHPETTSTKEGPVMADTYYLESLTRPRPGDSFPDVGYVRRFLALADGAAERDGKTRRS